MSAAKMLNYRRMITILLAIVLSVVLFTGSVMLAYLLGFEIENPNLTLIIIFGKL